ncbi:MAG: cardiolipin synthase [Oscillospiraceae bacterium]|nr:cardiolipin synthase [Oscillospiraceae bacterium]
MVGISIVAQCIFFALMIWYFQGINEWLYVLLLVLSAAATLFIISKNTNPAYKIAWVVPILLFPVFGGLFYLMLGGNRLSKRQRKKMNSVEKNLRQHLPQNPEIHEKLRKQSEQAALQSAYLQTVAGCPVYENTTVDYFSLGDLVYPVMLEELRKAENYIFLEYFIIGPGKMWDGILEILKEKAAAGLDVRVMYDDFGCIQQLPVGYRKTLNSYGIKCCIFEPFIPVVSARLNNRDHRKLMIIDGKVGFTGGINLADEYINEEERFGHWKDNAIMLRGDAVWSMTVMFLSLWDYVSGGGDSIARFLPPEPEEAGTGFVQPYTDNPLDDEPVGGSVYTHLIERAVRSVYIMTPYLIIDYAMTESLCNAAKSGLDVRIITPHIPDKWYVHAVTRAHYEQLVKCGVKVYEYTPGFIHSKVFAVDGEYATVGTINLDFRSLYLHFENGVFMYRTDCISDIYRDFEETFRKSRLITLEDCKTNIFRRLLRSLLRLFAPLM